MDLETHGTVFFFFSFLLYLIATDLSVQFRPRALQRVSHFDGERGASSGDEGSAAGGAAQRREERLQLQQPRLQHRHDRHQAARLPQHLRGEKLSSCNLVVCVSKPL